MNTVESIDDLRHNIRQARAEGKKVAFVPTMGNLHEGHISLVERARQDADFVVTSIFVNPMQFGQNEDLDSYPRTLDDDKAKLMAAGNDLLFLPTPDTMYPKGLERQTQVIVPFLTDLHCGASRPGHFTGVSTVVNILFNLVQPDVAVFGEKDYQQLAVIRKMVKDLHMPIQIIGEATKRADDGLALSSRNGYLSEEERKQAPTLYKTLQSSLQQLKHQEGSPEDIATIAKNTLAENGFKVDYYNIVDGETLRPATGNESTVTILAAAFLGSTRLIDNVSTTL